MECPQCGGTSSDDAQFCANCGAPLPQTGADEQVPVPEQGSKDDWGQYDQPEATPPQETPAPQVPGGYDEQAQPVEAYAPPPMAYGQVPPPPGGTYSYGGPPQTGPFSYGGPPPHIPNHLVWAILTTLFCCLPAGVVSIVYAAQVNGKIQVGDYETAKKYSDRARTWAIVSAVLVVVYIAVILMFVFSVGISQS
jgi:hypothetical protein